MPEQTHNRHNSWYPFIGIVLLFGSLAPLFGTLSVAGWLGLQGAWSAILLDQWERVFPTLASTLFIGPLFGLPLGYLVGGLPASIVGCMVAMGYRRKAQISLRIAMVTAGLLYLLLLLLPIALISNRGALLTWLGATLFATLVATALCTWIARRVFLKTQ